jgi:hypothetical protein
MAACPRPSGSHLSRIGPSPSIAGANCFLGYAPLIACAVTDISFWPVPTPRKRVAMLTAFGRKPGALIKAL